MVFRSLKWFHGKVGEVVVSPSPPPSGREAFKGNGGRANSELDGKFTFGERKREIDKKTKIETNKE